MNLNLLLKLLKNVIDVIVWGDEKQSSTKFLKIIRLLEFSLLIIFSSVYSMTDFAIVFFNKGELVAQPFNYL